MTDDPFFCDDCEMDLGHDEIETVPHVPQVDIDSFELTGQPANVHKCAACGMIIGLTLQ